MPTTYKTIAERDAARMKRIADAQKTKQPVTAEQLKTMPSAPKINPITGTAYSPAQVASLEAQRKQLTGETSTKEAQAARDAAMAKSLASSKSINNYTFQDTKNLQAQMALNKKYGLSETTGLTGKPLIAMSGGQPGLEVAPESARDFPREIAMAKKIGINLNTLTPEQERQLFKATYSQSELQNMGLTDYVSPSPVAGVSVSGGVAGVSGAAGVAGASTSGGMPSPYDPAKLKAMGLSDAQIAALQQSGGAANAAAGSLGATPKPTQSAMAVLQEALNAKNNVTNQPLGKSQLFEQAGLSGYETLAQSLNMRGREMNDRYNSFKATVADTATGMVDTYNAALEGYKTFTAQYNQELDRMMELNAEEKKWNQTLELMQRQNDLDIEKETTLAALKGKEPPKLEFNPVTGEAIQWNSESGEWESKDFNGNVTSSTTSPTFVDDDAVNTLLKSRQTQKFETSISYNIPGQRKGKHDGLDIVLEGGIGASIPTPVSGTVTEINSDKYPGQKKGWGNQIVIKDENGNLHKFNHLNNFANLKVGQQIDAGTIIGGQGSTGYSTGAHIDYRIWDGKKWIDPTIYLTSGEQKPTVTGMTDAQILEAVKGSGVDITKMDIKETSALIAKAKKYGMSSVLGDTMGTKTLPFDMAKEVNNIVQTGIKEPVIRNFAEVSTQLDYVNKVNPNTATATDKMALIYTFAKVMDPNSAVREGEYASVGSNARSYIESLGLNAQKIFTNPGELPTESVKMLQKTLNEKYGSFKSQYETFKKGLEAQINLLGVDNYGTSGEDIVKKTIRLLGEEESVSEFGTGGVNIQGAINAGYSTVQILEYAQQQGLIDINAARNAGYSDEEILNSLK